MVGRFRWIGVASLAFMGLMVLGIAAMCIPSSPAEADPPTDQEYTGSKRCASCHFEEYTKWKASPHAKAFSLLTKKYEADAKCLKCHTTGYGEKTGYGAVNDESLKDVGCETCHGPGSKHEEACKPFMDVKELTKEQEEQLRGSIWKMLPKNVCVECHTVQGHGDSQTPPELKKKTKKK